MSTGHTSDARRDSEQMHHAVLHTCGHTAVLNGQARRTLRVHYPDLVNDRE